MNVKSILLTAMQRLLWCCLLSRLYWDGFEIIGQELRRAGVLASEGSLALFVNLVVSLVVYSYDVEPFRLL